MKKTAKKLSIHRETLINLGRYQVSGGAYSDFCGPQSHGSCDSCVSCNPTISGHCITTTDDTQN